MPTLFQILKDKIAGKPQPKPPVGPQIYNPINAKVGNAVTIDDIDYRGKNFFVKEIRELSITVDPAALVPFKNTDYVLQANPLNGDPITIRLRIAPAETGSFGLPFRALILSLYYESEYNDGINEAVNDPTKKFMIDDGPVHEEYWRVNDVGIPYPVVIVSVGSQIPDKIEYWDFSRMTKIDNVEVEQFLFVEKNSADGYFQMWKGFEINPEQVMVI